ncbi:MAG TPA: folylpolyglutamate synthase/dihydrofolate synthase family protein [Ktedonobacterales bacterium]|nr:folylpolyglutamate synthase/dihydrofolate synthase family protein [Ktedonobacterales bacterium]
MMTYAEAIAWLDTFTNTERSGAFLWEGETSLVRERALLAQLENPQRAYGITHVAGTKGKGSTSALVAAILQAAGIHTGLYTQPELHTLRERIRAGQQLISEDEMAGLLSQVREALPGVDTSLGPFITYELMTALALLFFREAGAQHAVIEVGLGGRLDATNIVEPMVSVITSISYDHMHVLGNTLTEIAGEKAGIIKPGVPVVCSAQAPEAVAVINRRCEERGAPLLRVGPEHTPDCQYTYQDEGADDKRQWFTITTPSQSYRHLELSLLGAHQLENATAATAVVETLRAQGLPVDEMAIRQGLRSARWPGRLQVVRRQPLLVVDGAHNADSFARLFAALRRHFVFGRLLLVLGTMADKDVSGIAAEIVHAGVNQVVVTGAAHPRAAAPDMLAAALASARQREITICADVAAALRLALGEAGASDLVCVAGSLYLAGEVLRWAEKEQASQRF